MSKAFEAITDFKPGTYSRMNIVLAVAIIVKELMVIEKNERYPLDEYGDPIGPDWDVSESSPAANIARLIATQVLVAAKTNGLHGCRLCRS
jgi:hypothetical protein